MPRAENLAQVIGKNHNKREVEFGGFLIGPDPGILDIMRAETALRLRG